MKTIIATIKPIHLRNIRTGNKIFEIRKTRPKEVPFKVLCCESGSGGQIKAEFICYEAFLEHTEDVPTYVERARISQMEALHYSKGCRVWFWKIDKMIDYCSTKCNRIKNIKEFGLNRAPQSWQYVEDLDENENS